MARRLQHRIAVLAATASAAALLAGCGGQPGSGSAGSTSADIRSAAQAALRLWSSFPASASPRPVVLLGGRLVAPTNGFTNEDDQLAFTNASFRLKVPSPSTPTHSDGYAIVPAGQLLKTPGISAAALLVERITLGTASFQTDRGFVPLPAWKLYFRGGTGPVSLLALAPGVLATVPPALQPRSTAVVAIGSAAASSDGSALTVSFTGGLAGSKPCDVRYTASVATSTHAVAISLIPHPVPVPPKTACPLVAMLRQFKIKLPDPLGNRVLINGADGAVIPVAIGAASPGTATNPEAGGSTSTGTTT